MKQEVSCERCGEAARSVGRCRRDGRQRAGPEKEGWERMEGEVVKAARGRAGFIV